MLPFSFPRFNLQSESTAVLRLGWVFFLLLGVLLTTGAWMEANPRPGESAEQIRYRFRREAIEQLRERGIKGGFPQGEPPAPAPPPPVRWDRVFGFLFTGLAAWITVWWRIHRELGFRAGGKENLRTA